jgi:hypothetical protein
MNAFNIRELQGILKRRFFNDLVNTTDHRQFMNQTLIGIRFKNNFNLSINPDTSLIYNFGTTLPTKTKTTILKNIYDNSSIFRNDRLYFTGLFKFIDTLSLQFFLSIANYSLSNLAIVLKEFLKTITSSLPGVINHLLSLPIDIKNSFPTMISSNANLNVNNTLNNLKNGGYTESVSKVLFTSENINSNSQVDENQMSELSNNIRFTRFNNPLISYDYKCGNYIGS